MIVRKYLLHLPFRHLPNVCKCSCQEMCIIHRGRINGRQGEKTRDYTVVEVLGERVRRTRRSCRAWERSGSCHRLRPPACPSTASALATDRRRLDFCSTSSKACRARCPPWEGPRPTPTVRSKSCRPRCRAAAGRAPPLALHRTPLFRVKTQCM